MQKLKFNFNKNTQPMIVSLEGEFQHYKTFEETRSLVEKITTNASRIKEINFTCNVFDPEILEGLFIAIEECKNLRVANLNGIFSTLDNQTMIKCLEIVSKHLPSNKLEIFDLSDNALSCNLPEEFRTFIKRCHRLKVLKINNCGLGSIGGDWLAESLIQLETKDLLEHVEIAQNKFINFPKKMGIALKQFTFLEVIKIQYNTIEEVSLEEFITNFKTHPLKELDLTDNFLSLSACKLLGELFASCGIEKLLIGDYIMKDEGLNAFLEAASNKWSGSEIRGAFIEGSDTLCLDISYNEITQSGIEALKAFCENHFINELVIKGNEYEDCSELVSTVILQGGVVKHDYNENEIIDVREEVEIALAGQFNNVL